MLTMPGDKLYVYPKQRDWETNMYLVSWGNPAKGIMDPKLGYLQQRIYGGYAFSHMR